MTMSVMTAGALPAGLQPSHSCCLSCLLISFVQHPADLLAVSHKTSWPLYDRPLAVQQTLTALCQPHTCPLSRACNKSASTRCLPLPPLMTAPPVRIQDSSCWLMMPEGHPTTDVSDRPVTALPTVRAVTAATDACCNA
jgi:hypothetical protein